MVRLIAVLTLIVLAATCFTQAPRARRPLTLTASADSGCVLYLSDGSVYEVRSENRIKASTWKAGSPVGIFRANDKLFPYRIVLKPGKADGDVVSAIRLTRVK